MKIAWPHGFLPPSKMRPMMSCRAEVVAENTSDLTALNQFPTPAWETWLRDVLHPVFPAWAAQLASEQPAEFAGADTAWEFLHRHEPQTARQPQMARGLRSLPAAGDAYADLETFCLCSRTRTPACPGQMVSLA